MERGLENNSSGGVNKETESMRETGRQTDK